MRYAIYFTPLPDNQLARAAASWIGHDVFTGALTSPPAVGELSSDEVARHTAAAQRYGFHATLKPPFHLAEGQREDGLLGAFQDFCKSAEPFTIPKLVIARIGKFFALVPEEKSKSLNDFADTIVTTFEQFRAPLSDADIARRNPDMLSATQRENLDKWGYPYVFDEFRFHMTLTGPVQDEHAERVEQALREWFAPCLGGPVDVSTLALFIEPEPGAPFRVHTQTPLGAIAKRKTA